MNIAVTEPLEGVQPPPAPKRLEGMKLHPVMMRDILLKTMFRMNVTLVSEIARAICLPIPVTQELVDMARGQRLLEAMGTLNAASLIGAGDAKLAAAAAPFVALSDWRTLLWLYPLTLLVCWLLHRLAKHTVGRQLAPGWVSWESGKRFPMGIALAVTLLAYLGMAATTPV